MTMLINWLHIMAVFSVTALVILAGMIVSSKVADFVTKKTDNQIVGMCSGMFVVISTFSFLIALMETYSKCV